MESYDQLKEEFDKKIEALQKRCKHKKTHWAEFWWAMAHSAGYEVKVCDRCRKILEEKPTKEERKKADEEWFEKQEREKKEFDKKVEKVKEKAKELNRETTGVIKRAKVLFFD